MKPPLVTPATTEAGYVLASPALRALAWLSDGLLFAVPTLAVAWVVGGDHLYTVISKLVLDKSGPGTAFGSLVSGHPEGAHHHTQLGLQVAVTALVFLGAITLWVIYRVGLTAWRGATFGKWAWGTRVVRAEDITRPPNLRRAITRWVVPQTAGLLPLPGTGLLPCLWLVRDRRRQGAHDKAARTLVIRRPSRSPLLGGAFSRRAPAARRSLSAARRSPASAARSFP